MLFARLFFYIFGKHFCAFRQLRVREIVPDPLVKAQPGSLVALVLRDPLSRLVVVRHVSVFDNLFQRLSKVGHVVKELARLVIRVPEDIDDVIYVRHLSKSYEGAPHKTHTSAYMVEVAGYRLEMNLTLELSIELNTGGVVGSV